MSNVKRSLIDSKTTEKRLPYPGSKTIKSTVSRYRIEDVNPPYIKEEIRKILSEELDKILNDK